MREILVQWNGFRFSVRQVNLLRRIAENGYVVDAGMDKTIAAPLVNEGLLQRNHVMDTITATAKGRDILRGMGFRIRGEQ
ncbi:hypothetical protein [Bifidobacterium callitrichidarum]|uniref:hypothetical protein n=1 Tax=Bifidobacterium callitrichidarum TaxID=2052941 RepID=UPI0011B2756E|nr:hypothetical protein [Bifidobacterium callitrichidarum]